MNGIDIAILTIMGLSCLMGIVRGLTKEVLGLFTWAGSAFAAYMTYPFAAEFAREHIANPMIADSVTAVGLFILFLIAFSIITFNISNAVRSSAIGGLDRGLGLAFGVVRGAVLICAAEIAFSLFISREAQSETIQSARFIPMVRRGSDEILLMLPTQWREMLDQQTKNLQNLGKTAGSAAPQLLMPVVPPSASIHTPAPDESKDASPTANGESQRQSTSLQQTPAYPNALASTDVSNAIPQALQQGMGTPQANRTPAPGLGNRNTTQADRDKTADSLSDLKPTAADIKGNEGTYDKRQQRELDRLIEASE